MVDQAEPGRRVVIVEEAPQPRPGDDRVNHEREGVEDASQHERAHEGQRTRHVDLAALARLELADELDRVARDAVAVGPREGLGQRPGGDPIGDWVDV